jgi:hypothetical protein
MIGPTPTLAVAAWKTTPQYGLPSSEETLTVPLVPGRRVLTVPL